MGDDFSACTMDQGVFSPKAEVNSRWIHGSEAQKRNLYYRNRLGKTSSVKSHRMDDIVENM